MLEKTMHVKVLLLLFEPKHDEGCATIFVVYYYCIQQSRQSKTSDFH